jgi:Domain of unknown function (DUF6458)
MTYGASLLLVAAGAVLIWAVNATVSGVNVHAIGWILLIVGLVGFLLSLLFISESSWYRRRNYPPDDRL